MKNQTQPSAAESARFHPECASPDEMLLCSRTGNPLVYCEPVSAEGRRDWERHKAVIAAAPELLEQLRNAEMKLREAATQSVGPDWSHEQAHAFIREQARLFLPKIRAAIAKAEGRA